MIIIIIIIIIISTIIILEVGPHFSHACCVGLLTFFQISNVRPKVPTTTDFFQNPIFFDSNQREQLGMQLRALSKGTKCTGSEVGQKARVPKTRQAARAETEGLQVQEATENLKAYGFDQPSCARWVDKYKILHRKQTDGQAEGAEDEWP